jgi:hypothetical protein
MNALDALQIGNSLNPLTRNADAVNGRLGRKGSVRMDEFAVSRPSRVVADTLSGKLASSVQADVRRS